MVSTKWKGNGLMHSLLYKNHSLLPLSSVNCSCLMFLNVRVAYICYISESRSHKENYSYFKFVFGELLV